MNFAVECMGLAVRRRTGCRDRTSDEAQASEARASDWAGRRDRESRHSAGVRTMVHRMPDGRVGMDAAPTYVARSCAVPGDAIGRHVLHVVARRQRGARRQRKTTVERQPGARRRVQKRHHERHLKRQRERQQRHCHAQARCVRLSCSVVLCAQAWRSVFLKRAACCTASYIHCR
jgi:hypothetical protein